MNRKNIITGIIGICLFGLVSCSKPKEPDYIDFQNLRVQKASMDQSLITFDLRYFNPNDYRMQLKSASVDVYFNDKFVGRSVLDSLIHIPRLDTFSIPVSMNVGIKSLLANAAQLLLNPEVMVKLKGNARLGKGGLFVNVPIEYEGKQRVELFNRSDGIGR